MYNNNGNTTNTHYTVLGILISASYIVLSFTQAGIGVKALGL